MISSKKSYSTSSTSDEAPSPVYELRNYTFKFSEFRKILDLFEQFIPLRTSHSELIGFWTTELGASIHEVTHIWKYDSLGQRLRVRQGLANDETWMTDFVSKMAPSAHKMSTALLAPLPGSDVNPAVGRDQPSVGVYTLEEFSQGSCPVLTDQDSQQLVGNFLGIFGHTGREYRLRRFQDVDAAAAGAWKEATTEYRLRRFQDVDAAAAGAWKEATTGSPGRISNVLMYPTKWSPLQ